MTISETTQKIISDKRFHMLLIFIISLIIRLYILYNSYIINFFEGRNAYYDLSEHYRFLQDLVSGKPFYMDNYHEKYSPVTPTILYLLTLPLFWANIHIFKITIIGFAIILSINAVITYVLLRKYSDDVLLISILVIFNPVDLIGILSWGGISLAITVISITAILILQHDLNKYRVFAMILLVIISASAHRTGMVIHLVAFIIGLLIHFREIRFSKRIFAIIILLSTFFSYLFAVRVYSLVKTYMKQILNPTGDRTKYMIDTVSDNLSLSIFILLLSTVIIIVTYKRKEYLELHKIERVYLITGILLALVPVYDIVVSSRFIIALNPILLIFISYTFKIFDHWYKKAYTLILIILGLLTVDYSIERSVAHLREYWP